MQKFKPSLITAALVASGLAFASQPLYAQEAESPEVPEEETIERIEVRGFSTSLIQSLNQKRFGDTVSEQLSADDLGGLPDVSMADALTRLPGISAVRTGGQAAEINIRGLSGDFVFSTLNGREQVSTSGSRSIEFDQYPSELINSAAVYKSPKASLIEGGVAGTVELRTASPLSNSEVHTFNANVRGMFNDRADEIPGAADVGHRISFSYQGKFLDETLGLAFGYARLFQPSAAVQFIGFDYNQLRDYEGIYDNEECQKDEIRPNCELFSAGFEMQHLGGEETRDGYVAAIEWAPVSNFTLKADAFISKFDSEEFARGFRVLTDNATYYNPIYSGQAIIGGLVVPDEAGNTRIQMVNDDNQDFDQIENYGINADWTITDNLTAQFDISLSKAESNFRNGLLWTLLDDQADGLKRDDMSFAYQLNGLNLPDIKFSNQAAFTNPEYLYISKYGIYPFENTDELDAYRIDFQYTLDNEYFSAIEFGARYSDREYSNDRSVFEFGNDNRFTASDTPLQVQSSFAEVVNFQGDFDYFPSYLAIDLNAALNAWFPQGVPQPVQSWGPGAAGVINGNGQNGDTAWSVRESGDVFETVNAAYVQINIDTEIGGLPVTGNFGVRYVDTKQASTGLQDATSQVFVLDESTPEPGDGRLVTVSDPSLGAQNIVDEVGLINNFYRPVYIEHEYSDVLPSLNLNFAVSENSQVRFAAAKVMGRAPINRFAANTTVRVNEVVAERDFDSGEVTLSNNTAEITGNSRNSPYLEPFYATQYDISYEHYFSDTDGAFIAAAFYKDIESFIEDITTDPYDFAANGFNVPDEVQVQLVHANNHPDQNMQGKPVLDENLNPIFITVPTENGAYETAINNAEGGYIRGIELAYTQIYSMLPDYWSGLGLSASYSYTESEIQRTLGDGVFASDLPGLSENVLQLTLFWEYEGFETRISSRYRDQFVSQQVGINDQTVNFDEELVIDYQASYEINENFSVLFQVNNLTDEPTKSYFNTEAQTGTIQFFGTQYFLGVTYSL